MAVTVGVLAGLSGVTKAADKLQFNRDIRPLLSANCFACHGPDSASREADLRLDQREAAVDYGAIVPGEPDDSELVRRILAEDPDEMMPPPRSHKTLTADQKETLRRWVAEGAEYQPHWSFITPVRATPPAVDNAAWIKNPIDNFILATLQQHGLAPAPEADRRTLARRVSLDLIGLPPTPAEVDAFVNDPAPDAYEKFVDRLLASQHWGEHRGRYWLDAARYADTHGIHFDNFREIWAYRDWVIDAFNRNLPFDQFTVEQLAGDLLPNPTLEQQIASGFNRCNITTNEGGIIDEEYMVLYARDRTETTSKVWLGLTAGCAVCHDHKFDPLSQREFYELSAFFNNTTQAAKDGNIKDTPPVLVVPRPEDRDRWAALDSELPKAQQQVAARKQTGRDDFEKWLATVQVESLDLQLPSDQLQLHARMSEGGASGVQVVLNDQAPDAALSGEVASDANVDIATAGDFEKDDAFSCSVWVKISPNSQTGAIVARMDDTNNYRGWDLWIENGRVGSHIIHKWQDDAIKVVSKNPVQPDKWNHVLLTYDGTAKAAGVTLYVNGDAQKTDVLVNSLKETIRTQVPLTIAQRHRGSRLNGAAVQDLRIYGRALSAAEGKQLAATSRTVSLLNKPADQRTQAETSELFDWYLLTIDQPYGDATALVSALEGEQAAIKARGTIAHVMRERENPAMAHILFRGEYDQRRDAVHAGMPEFLPPMPADLPHDRLGFAKWLLLPENPLTARVAVNRFWQEVFGTGLVATAGDFGVAGQLPSHPELLDWLAIEFRESGWDVKRLFKLLVMSATYRQAAVVTPEKLAADPHNGLLSRGPRFRMDAEMIRDYALAVSSLLVPEIGGPSVKPYQPEGVWEAVAMIGSNTRDYKQDSGDNLYRRSLYTFWKRAAPPASMEIFNATSREVCTVERERTNTPLQALVTLNDPQFIEAARNLAQMALLQDSQTTESRVDLMAKQLLARPLRVEEVSLVTESLAELLTYYQSHIEDAKKLIAVGQSQADPKIDAATLAAWTMLANQMMNLDEVLNK